MSTMNQKILFSIYDLTSKKEIDCKLLCDDELSINSCYDENVSDLDSTFPSIHLAGTSCDEILSCQYCIPRLLDPRSSPNPSTEVENETNSQLEPNSSMCLNTNSNMKFDVTDESSFHNSLEEEQLNHFQTENVVTFTMDAVGAIAKTEIVAVEDIEQVREERNIAHEISNSHCESNLIKTSKAKNVCPDDTENNSSFPSTSSNADLQDVVSNLPKKKCVFPVKRTRVKPLPICDEITLPNRKSTMSSGIPTRSSKHSNSGNNALIEERAETEQNSKPLTSSASSSRVPEPHITMSQNERFDYNWRSPKRREHLKTHANNRESRRFSDEHITNSHLDEPIITEKMNNFQDPPKESRKRTSSNTSFHGCQVEKVPFITSKTNDVHNVKSVLDVQAPHSTTIETRLDSQMHQQLLINNKLKPNDSSETNVNSEYSAHEIVEDSSPRSVSPGIDKVSPSNSSKATNELQPYELQSSSPSPNIKHSYIISLLKFIQLSKDFLGFVGEPLNWILKQSSAHYADEATLVVFLSDKSNLNIFRACHEILIFFAKKNILPQHRDVIRVSTKALEEMLTVIKQFSCSKTSFDIHKLATSTLHLNNVEISKFLKHFLKFKGLKLGPEEFISLYQKVVTRQLELSLNIETEATSLTKTTSPIGNATQILSSSRTDDSHENFDSPKYENINSDTFSPALEPGAMQSPEIVNGFSDNHDKPTTMLTASQLVLKKDDLEKLVKNFSLLDKVSQEAITGYIKYYMVQDDPAYTASLLKRICSL